MERADALRMLQTQRDIATTLKSLQRENRHDTSADHRTQAGLSDALHKIEDAQSILFRTAFEPALTSATDNVFSTFELVDTILAHLKTEDILFATQVCRYWREVIERSSAIQARMRVVSARPSLPHTMTIHDDCHSLYDGAQPWLFEAKLATGKLITMRKGGYEVFLFVHASRKLPMRVLPSKLKRVYSNLAGLCAGVEFYDAHGELLCSKEYSLRQLAPRYMVSQTKAKHFTVYMNRFYWRQALGDIEKTWLACYALELRSPLAIAEYDERHAVEALALWTARLAREETELQEE